MKTVFGTFAIHGFTREEMGIAVFKRKTHTHTRQAHDFLLHTHTRQAHDHSEFFGIRDYNGFTMTTQIIFTIFINSIYAKRKVQLQYRLVSV
jgi:hypothetical protein